ncbi:MAG: hypothetical protein IAE87_12250 [Rhodobacteraceae bacterium]|jgi:hypothetical protein|nr:hypothetical protein [Paracoccaceae bacterium]
MTRFATILTAAAVLAGSAQLALAERHVVFTNPTQGTQVEVVAGDVLSNKELIRAGKSAGEVMTVTLLPEGAPIVEHGGNR